jgi:serine/threonine-protein kinase
VTVVVAREPLIPVPDVTTQEPAAAAATLGAAGFQVTQVSVPHDTVPVGKVVGTDPLAGTPLPKGSAVTLQVSSGPSTIPMPSVVNAKRADAEALLNGVLGLGLQVNLVNAGPTKKGLVVTQSPAPGTPVQKGSAVQIFVGI